MSSEGVARARDFYRKADELLDLGHLLRSAENFGRAAEAARALDSRPDNIVVVAMQRFQAGALLMHSTYPATVGSNALAALRVEIVALLSAVAASLERRRVAGTLLEGKCTAAEEAWQAAEFRSTGSTSHCDYAVNVGRLFGYDTFMCAAGTILGLLGQNAWQFAEECSDSQFQTFAQLVVHAAGMMQLPRCFGTIAMPAEQSFAYWLSKESGVAARRVDEDWSCLVAQPLVDAWQRLRRSGVLEARRMLDERGRPKNTSDLEVSSAVVEAAMAAPGLRSCALAGCSLREAHPRHFKRCSACQLVVYCSKKCQLEDWPAHKAACKAARKTAAASSDGGAGPGTAS